MESQDEEREQVNPRDGDEMGDCVDRVRTILSQWIPALDLGSDLVVVLLSMFDGSYNEQTLFFVGFIIFWVSQGIRVLHQGFFTELQNCYHHIYKPDKQISSKSCFPFYRFVCLMNPVWLALAGTCGVVLQGLVLALTPADFIMSLAYNSKARKGHFKMVMLSGWLWTMDKGWRRFFYSRKLFGRYYHVFCSLFCGGRWIATNYWEWAKKNDVEFYRDSVRKNFCRLSHALAITEEVLENVGGILMSIGILTRDWDLNSNTHVEKTLAIFQLCMSGISALFESGVMLRLFEESLEKST